MFIINKESNSIQKIQQKNFSELGFGERSHLQIWIEKNALSLGEELLFIQKEFSEFDDTNERLDLLALDKNGDLVIIENKLDDSGRDVTWQALKYASYCSTLSKHQILEIYQKYLNKISAVNQDPKANILEFLEQDNFDEISLNQKQRIILVANHYRKEVTSTVLWLMTKYNLSIQCFKATPYEYDNQVFLDMEQIIPIKEAEEFMIKMAEKNQEDQLDQNNLKDRQVHLLEFWRQLIDECKKQNFHLFSDMSPLPQNYISAGAGISGVGFVMGINSNLARIELYISKSNQPETNKKIFDVLNKQKSEIEQKTGELIWERLDKKIACRIKKEIKGVGLADKESWGAAIQFLIVEMRLFSENLKPYIEKIRANDLI